MEPGSSTPISQNLSYHQNNNGMNTLVPPSFGEIQPPFNPGQPMSYPVHHTQNSGFWVPLSSGIYIAPFSHHRSSDVNTLVPPFNPGQQMYHIQNPGFPVHPSSSGIYIPPFLHHHTSDMNTPVPPNFGQQQNENSYGQLHPGINPGYEMNQMEDQVSGAVNPAVYQMHEIQQDLGFQKNPYNYIQQQVNPAVNQPPAQIPPQQVQADRIEGEEVVVVEAPEPPLLPMTITTGSRFRWTPELERRFARAAKELGGYFEATPKEILRRMNVIGMTQNQIKSHLQKVRNRILPNLYAEGNVGSGNQGNTTTGAPQFLVADEAIWNFTPNNESPIGQPNRLLRSSEMANNDQNHRSVPVVNPPSSVNLEDFDLQDNSQSLNDNADIGIALDEDPPSNLKFTNFDWAPNDNEDFEFALLEDPIRNYILTISHNQYRNQNLRIAMGVDNALDHLEFKDSDFSLRGSHN